MKKYVLYHSGCADGFCAAFLFHMNMVDGETIHFIPVQYGQPVPSDIEGGSEVYIADFSYSKEQLEELAGKVATLTVLDHHKTAQAALASFSAPNARCVFDMGRSGAQIAYDEIFNMHDRQPKTYYPKIVQYVADRDLWKFELPNSREVNLYIQTHPYDFLPWKALWQEVEQHYSSVVFGGEAVMRFQEQQIKRAIKHRRIVMHTVIYEHPRFQKYRVAVVNSPNFQSEIGEALCNHDYDGAEPADPIDFACIWYQDEDGNFIHSLRSRGDMDVAEVAKRYGGGGHKNAAGFVSTSMKVA